ncbi:hypothetical protein V1512DRAFT_256889 [Lipomyces arxii]|uniref:uncharacterized protein n=1 Tax=Lipomyces arxii TaxID=56418 RepID=UPI0034CE8B04
MNSATVGRTRHAITLEYADWVELLLPDTNGAQYVEIGHGFLVTADWENAFACFTKALDRLGASAQFEDVAKALEGRYKAATELGASEFALMDAIEMAHYDDSRAKGYLLAGDVLMCMHKYGDAEAMYRAGTLSIQADDTIARLLVLKRETAALQIRPSLNEPHVRKFRKMLDPIACLPRELALAVLSYVPVLDRLPLLQVSQAWNEGVSQSLCDITDLDLERAKWPAGMSVVAKLIGSARSVDRVALGKVPVRQADAWCETVLRGEAFANLRSFTLLTSTSVFSTLAAKLALGLDCADRLAQLRNLRVRVEHAPAVCELLAANVFPTLHTLDFYAEPTIVPDKVWHGLLPHSDAHVVQYQLRILKIGGSPALPWLFPYMQLPVCCNILPDGLQNLLCLVPNIEELHLVNVNLRYITRRLFLDRPLSLRLNLNLLTPQLKVLDVSYSKLRASPRLPTGCVVMRMDCTDTVSLRTCRTFRGTRYYTDVLDNENDGYFLAEDAAEYSSLTEVSMMRSVTGPDKIFDGLARCSERLTSLNLHGCTTLDFGRRVPPMCDFVAHFEQYGYDAPPGLYSSIADVIANMFPNLTKLWVGCNETVTDNTLQFFATLSLTLLDVSSTSVTDSGIIKFVSGPAKSTIKQLVLTGEDLPEKLLSALRQAGVRLEELGGQSPYVLAKSKAADCAYTHRFNMALDHVENVPGWVKEFRRTVVETAEVDLDRAKVYF